MLFDFHTFGPGVDPSLCNKIIKKEILEKIICDIDENNLTPMQAFNVLLDLKEKLKN